MAMTKTDERRGKRRLLKVVKANIENRQTRVGQLYCEGKTQSEIGQLLEQEGFGKTSQPTVSLDLKAIRAIWEEKRVMDFDKRLSEELAKLDRLEEKLNIAYEKSCEDAVEVTVMKAPKRGLSIKLRKGEIDSVGAGIADKPTVTQEITKTKGQYGDISILTEIRAVIEKRCKLLGLLDERAVSNNINQQNVDFSTLLGRKSDPQLAEKRVSRLADVDDPLEVQLKELEKQAESVQP